MQIINFIRKKKKKLQFFLETKQLIVMLMIGVLCVCENYSPVIDIVIFIILMALTLLSPIKMDFFMTIECTFFDDVMLYELTGSTAARWMAMLTLLKIGLYFLKEKKGSVHREKLGILLFYGITVVIGLYTNGLTGLLASTVFNVVFIVSCSIYFSSGKMKVREIFNGLMYACLIATAFSGVYGILHWNFMEITNYGFIRFMGAMNDPNYAAAFWCIALAIVMTNKNLLPTKTRILLGAMYTAYIFATVSLMGNLCMVLMYFVFTVFAVKKTRGKQKRNACIAIVAVIIVGGAMLLPAFWKTGIGIRVQVLLPYLKEGNFDVVTSERTVINRSVVQAIFDRDPMGILLGNGLSDMDVYCDELSKNVRAHNVYLQDLYGYGVIGGTIAILYMLKKTISGSFLGENKDEDIRKTMRAVRLCCLFCAMALMLTGRVYFAMFLL